MEYTIAILIPIGVALTQAMKQAIPSRFVPLTSIGIGIALAFLGKVGATVPLTLLGGLTIGLAAAGLYDVGSKTIGNK